MIAKEKKMIQAAIPKLQYDVIKVRAEMNHLSVSRYVAVMIEYSLKQDNLI